MLDITLFRTDKGGNPDAIRQSQRRRFEDEGLVDDVIQLDTKWRQLSYQTENLSKQLNAISQRIATLKKAKEISGEEEVAELSLRSKTLRAEMQAAKAEEDVALTSRTAALMQIGNILHDDVPTSNNEAQNRVLREVGDRPPPEPWMRSHPELAAMLGIINLEAGQAAAGSRGYYLLGQGVMLNQALINYSLQFLVARGFEPVQTPFFMIRDVMADCAQLSQFDDELYRISEGDATSSSGSDKYLVATSEQPLCALHRHGWFDAADLPLRYAGFSTCFRREAGSHGKDTLGLFRVHQFEKIEQFCIAPPDGKASWQMMEEMIGHAGDFYSSLGLPYRVVSLVSGALNKSAAMKYDLEGWFPSGQAFRELVSCSNCTDYQARRLDIRVRMPKGPALAALTNATEETPQVPQVPTAGNMHVHMLNSTLAATQRTLCAILENHQTPDGVKVPEPLRPFMMGLDFLPFKAKVASAARALRHLKK